MLIKEVADRRSLEASFAFKHSICKWNTYKLFSTFIYKYIYVC